MLAELGVRPSIGNDVIVVGSRGLRGASMFGLGGLKANVGPTNSREHNRTPPYGSRVLRKALMTFLELDHPCESVGQLCEQSLVIGKGTKCRITGVPA